MQLARGDGTGAFFLHLGIAGSAQAQIQVGGRQRKLISARLEQIIRKYRDGCLALDDALGRSQLSQQFKLADRDLQRPYRSGRFDRHKISLPRRAATFSTSLISNTKPIKPVVTVGASQKWKSRATRLFSFAFEP